MDHPTNTGNETRPVPTIHLDAAEMAILLLLGRRPATLADLAHSTWLDPSQLYLVLGRLVHRWLAEQSGAHYGLTRSGMLLSSKIRAVVDAMGEGQGSDDEKRARRGEPPPGPTRDTLERVEDLLKEAYWNPAHLSGASSAVIPVGETGNTRIDQELGDLSAMAMTMEKFIDFFESHSLEGVPQEALDSLGDLLHAELTCDISLNFLHGWSQYRRIIEEAQWVHGVSSFATPDIAEVIGKRVLGGVRVVLIITPDLADTILKEPYLEMARDLWRYRNLKFRVSRIPIRIGLTVTDKALSFGLFTRSGQTYDAVYDLVSRSPESLLWGERLFAYYREHSDPLPGYMIKSALSSLLRGDIREK